MKGGYKASCAKILIFYYLLRGQYLFEILHTSPIVKTSKTGKTVVKSVCFWKLSMEKTFFREMKEK